MAMRAQTTSKAAQGLLPQLEAAIAYLNEEIKQIRSGQKDQHLHELIADPLPREQFSGLLQVWKLPPVPVELSKLFVQLEELREKEKQTQEEENEAVLEGRENEKEDPDSEEVDVVKIAIEDEMKEKEDEDEKEEVSPRHTRAQSRPQPDASATDGTKDNEDKMEVDEESGKEDVGVMESDDNASADMNSITDLTTVAVDATVEETDPTPEVIEAVPQSVAAQQTEETKPPTAVSSPVPSIPEKPAVVVVPSGSVATASHPAPIPATAPPVTKAGTAREIALVNLRALRRSMMLDVLSKIVSVAKSKGVDPAMFSSRPHATNSMDPPTRSSFVDLEMIQREVSKGTIAEWEHFAQQVYLFCQHVIAESEKQDRQDAKQKGVELLHFAKTLTETLRKASLKKEETIMKTTPTTTPTSSASGTPSADPARPSLAPVIDTKPSVMPADQPDAAQGLAKASAPSESAPISTPPTSTKSPVSDHPVATTATIEDPEPTSATESPAEGALPAASATTPHRMSTRLRQRENSVDSPSPSRRRSGQAEDDKQADGGAATTPASGMETRTRKRPRTAATLVVATDDHSASESQLSATEATTTTNPEDDKKPRTRKRREIQPATRVSSRQQKRRATQAAKAAAAAAAADGEEAKGDSEPEDHEGAATEENDGDDDQSDTKEKAVPLTKAGRPRKKPGRPRKKPLESK